MQVLCSLLLYVIYIFALSKIGFLCETFMQVINAWNGMDLSDNSGDSLKKKSHLVIFARATRNTKVCFSVSSITVSFTSLQKGCWWDSC